MDKPLHANVDFLILNHAYGYMLTQDVKQQIQDSYSKFLKNKELKPRSGQKEMIAHIARSLGAIEMDADGQRINEAGICAIEAGTGTGKTVAYTIAVLPIAKALGKKVVISTATVALQEQILLRDLPDIQRHSGLSFRFALAKGRGRYLCLSKLDQHLNADQTQHLLFGSEDAGAATDQNAVQLYESMAKALLTSRWDGDRDNWATEISNENWQPLTADRNQCTGRRCQHVAQCSFIKARESLGAADCVVANHDLVMADLALGGGVILPAPSETIYIFDEAHHLADIALKHFAGQVRIQASLHWLDQSIKVISDITRNFSIFNKLLDTLDDLPSLFLEIKKIYAEVKPLVENIVQPVMADFTGQSQLPYFRFEHGKIPDRLHEISRLLLQRFNALIDGLTASHGVIGNALEDNDTRISIAQLEQLYAAIGMMVNMAERQAQVWRAYAQPVDGMPDSRWIQIVEVGGLLDFELSTSPLLAANTLQMFLWKRCFSAVLTSATLTALGEFERLHMHSGMPYFAEKTIVQSPFDYMKNACFVVPKLNADPADHKSHSEEIARVLPDIIKNHQGILVLFASKRQLADVYELLDARLQEVILCQNNMSKQKLLKQHIQQIDNEQQSILFGLASFAEGVDLPGKYCTHVIIAKLPFSVPNDPVESGLSEWFEAQGRNAFMEISLPDASRRLIQACGRLIRSESDTGQVTLLDKRILTKRYGAQLLNSLPPFRRILEGS
jgi:ATP-dependent DNA helicase DinG